MPDYTRQNLLTPTSSLFKALSTTPPPALHTLLAHFTRSPLPIIHEHGHPSLAPFLGRTFTGTDGIARYFSLLQDLLEITDMVFDDPDDWVVDTTCLAVFLRGQARFTWKKTGQSWDETFAYRVALAEEDPDPAAGSDLATTVKGSGYGREVGSGSGNGMGGTGTAAGAGRGGLKVQEYLVWADTGCAYLARTGGLKEIQAEREREGKETSRSRERRRRGCGEVVGSGMGAYGSCS